LIRIPAYGRTSVARIGWEAMLAAGAVLLTALALGPAVPAAAASPAWVALIAFK
jgi:hypothetical protein